MVTHSDSQPKSVVKVQWQAPPGFYGNAIFRYNGNQDLINEFLVTYFFQDDLCGELFHFLGQNEVITGPSFRAQPRLS